MSEAERRRLRDTGREGLRGATSRKERTHSVFEGVRGEAKAACRGGILCGAAWGDWATACHGAGPAPPPPPPPPPPRPGGGGAWGEWARACHAPPPPPRLPSAEDPGMRGGLCHPVVAGLWDPRNETTPRSRVASVCFDCSAARFCCAGPSTCTPTRLPRTSAAASQKHPTGGAPSRGQQRPERLPPRRGEEGVAVVAGRRTGRACRRPVVDDRGVYRLRDFRFPCEISRV
jgi:hypothetical protein